MRSLHFARCPAAGTTGPEHASRGKRAWVSAPFAVARGRRGHRTPGLLAGANAFGRATPRWSDDRTAANER